MKECLIILLKTFDFHVFYENGELHVEAKFSGLNLENSKKQKNVLHRHWHRATHVVYLLRGGGADATQKTSESKSFSGLC